MVEIVISIAIMTLMLGIVVGVYSFGRSYDTMRSETMRLASTVRNLRSRAFNGVTAFDGTVNSYPRGGYGLHLQNNTNTCVGDTHILCALDADCFVGAVNKGPCTSATTRSSYILYADFDDDETYDGGFERLEQVGIAANFSLGLPSGATIADILFTTSTSTVFQGGAAQTTGVYTMEILYQGLANCPSAVRDTKGSVDFDVQYQKVYEQFLAC